MVSRPARQRPRRTTGPGKPRCSRKPWRRRPGPAGGPYRSPDRADSVRERPPCYNMTGTSASQNNAVTALAGSRYTLTARRRPLAGWSLTRRICAAPWPTRPACVVVLLRGDSHCTGPDPEALALRRLAP